MKRFYIALLLPLVVFGGSTPPANPTSTAPAVKVVSAGLPAVGHDALQVTRWKAASVTANKVSAVRLVVDRIVTNQSRYAAVEAASGVPWHVVASLHNMEASGSFKCHLHEGSPLTGRTRWVPKGRPKTGKPPFEWSYSATDAMNYDRMGAKKWGELGPALSACEGYNGWGYRDHHPGTPSPYLWAGTSVERSGKYIADGKWSSTARSGQIGVAAIWKELQRRGIIHVSTT